MPSSSFEDVAARIRPGMRVGIDGVSAAGKTTFADRLAAALDLPAVRLSIDDFHRPPEERVRYPEDTFDEAAFRAAVEAAPRDRVAIVDGIFIHKPELRGLWDLSIWLDVDRQLALERGIARDGMRARYLNRYYPAETRYLEEVRPHELADLVVSTA